MINETTIPAIIIFSIMTSIFILFIGLGLSMENYDRKLKKYILKKNYKTKKFDVQYYVKSFPLSIEWWFNLPIVTFEFNTLADAQTYITSCILKEKEKQQELAKLKVDRLIFKPEDFNTLQN